MPPSYLYPALSILNLWFHLWAWSWCCNKHLPCTFSRSYSFIFCVEEIKNFKIIVIDRSCHLQVCLTLFIYKYCSKIHQNIVCKFAVTSSACTFSLWWGKVKSHSLPVLWPTPAPCELVLRDAALSLPLPLPSGWEESGAAAPEDGPGLQERTGGKTCLGSGAPCFKGSMV